MTDAQATVNPREIHAFEDFTVFLRDPQEAAYVLSPTRWSDALGVPLALLATQAGVHRNTLRLSPAAPTVQAYLLQSLRVLRAAYDLSGDMQVAFRWFRTEPLAPFKYSTAESLVTQGRATDVLDYIESLSAGALG